MPMKVYVSYLAEDEAGRSAGARVVEPPPNTHQAQRGRFYAVADLRDETVDTKILTERLLSAMQRTYYSFKGSQSQVMQATIQQARQLLLAELGRSGAQPSMGVICIGLLNDRLAMAGLGDAFAFVTTDTGGVNVYPPDRLDPGAQPAPATSELWPLHRQKIGADTVILAATGRWLEKVSARALAGTTAYVDAANCQDAVAWLREQANQTDLPGLLLVLEQGPAAPPPPPSSGGGQPLTPRGSDLPTAVGATPPVTDVPPADVGRAATVSAPIGARPAPSNANLTEDVVEQGAPLTEDAAASPVVDSSADRSGVPVTFVAGAKIGMERARQLLGSMLPDRDASDLPDGRQSTAVAAAAMEAVESPARRADTASALAQSEPYIPPPRATGSRARTFVALAVILLLLVPATVAGVYWQQGASNRVQAESLLDLAEARLLSSQDALDRDDVTTGRTLLTEALNYADQAEEILGRTARGSDLVARIKRELQDVLHITLLYGIAQPLVTFPSDAEPQRVLVIDQDVYVLDTGRGQIIRYRLETTGQSLAESEGQVVLREGDIIDGVPVGPLVDIGWQAPIPGYEDKSNLLMLDNNNHVFRFNQQVDGVSLMDFGENNGWQGASQVETYSDRLYLADEGAGQVYRYAPGQYADPPVPWFDPATQINLNGVEAMRIDGDIWLLFDDGKVLRYHSGEQVPFGLDDSVALPGDPVDMYVSQEGADILYLADAQEERILLFSKQDGSYEGQFQAAEGNPLSGLRSVFIDEIRDTLFILTDSGLYQQDVPL